jgi:hypothetical protein
MTYKCTKCDKEGFKFGLCSDKKCNGLMLRKEGCREPEPKGWQPYRRGGNFLWKNRRHN